MREKSYNYTLHLNGDTTVMTRRFPATHFHTTPPTHFILTTHSPHIIHPCSKYQLDWDDIYFQQRNVFFVSLNPLARSNATKPLRINTWNVVLQRNHYTVAVAALDIC